jgi:hypothetical protein
MLREGKNQLNNACNLLGGLYAIYEPFSGPELILLSSRLLSCSLAANANR